MIPIKKIRYDNIEPVVLKMAEQVSIIKHELVDSQMIDMPIVEDILEQIENCITDIRKWADAFYDLKQGRSKST